jgi:hypothetical protein
VAWAPRLHRFPTPTAVQILSPLAPQAPGFLRSLEIFAPPGVHIIYTFPNFESCARIDLKKVLARWKRVTVLPLPIRASPMQVCGATSVGEIGPEGTGEGVCKVGGGVGVRGGGARWEG